MRGLAGFCHHFASVAREFAILLALVGSVASCRGPVASLFPPAAGEPPVTVHVIDHGWHTGLVVPRAAIPPGAWPEHRDFPDAEALEIGWGDRAFYQATDVTVWMALRAAFASEGSVLHVVGLRRHVAETLPGTDILAIALSRAGFSALVRYIEDSHARDADGRAVPLGPGLHGDSRFYLAAGRYTLLETCNTWIARALRAAGCPITPAFAVTAGNVMWQARAFGTRVQPRGGAVPASGATPVALE
jgi:uncharacterized protein (TIGR02117 family)